MTRAFGRLIGFVLLLVAVSAAVAWVLGTMSSAFAPGFINILGQLFGYPPYSGTAEGVAFALGLAYFLIVLVLLIMLSNRVIARLFNEWVDEPE